MNFSRKYRIAVVHDDFIQFGGAENLIFGNDCGFASTAGNCEIPTSVAWAKLQSLGTGAAIASKLG
jgi:5-methyltetrahydropteroyltriglutamate--homocysteine methyltransferase